MFDIGSYWPASDNFAGGYTESLACSQFLVVVSLINVVTAHYRICINFYSMANSTCICFLENNADLDQTVQREVFCSIIIKLSSHLKNVYSKHIYRFDNLLHLGICFSGKSLG